MISLTKAPSNLMREDREARIATSQNLLLDLVESEANRTAAAAPQNRFKPERRVERHYDSFPHGFNKAELTIKAPCDLTLDLEANRPDGNGNSSADVHRMLVGIFRNPRHGKATKLDDHVLVPVTTGQGSVSWQDQDGTSYTPQQLCDLAFQRLREHTS
jgi:hypothetical protein